MEISSENIMQIERTADLTEYLYLVGCFLYNVKVKHFLNVSGVFSQCANTSMKSVHPV